MKCIGSSTGEIPKVPTLRQAIRARLNIPTLNYVNRVFKPSKYPTITLLCEDKFRVNVREDESLYRDLIALFSDLEKDEVALFVEVPSDSEGRFSLLIDEDSKTLWEEKSWGFSAIEHKHAKKRASKKPRASLLTPVE